MHAEEKIRLVKDVASSVPNNLPLSKALLSLRNQLFGLTYNNLGCVEQQ
jgi:hypothetical protein